MALRDFRASVVNLEALTPKQPGPLGETCPLREKPDVFARHTPNNLAASNDSRQIHPQTQTSEPGQSLRLLRCRTRDSLRASGSNRVLPRRRLLI